MKNTENSIYFNFSYFALKLLGKGLYSNHWSAISELVANGLDAQASNVKIYINMIDKKHSVIEIFDNGNGMGYQDIAQKYAFLGQNKRINITDEEVKNTLMGRKGIGKLAALYLSNKYFLISKTNQGEVSAWCLDSSNVGDNDIPCLERYSVQDVDIECKKEWDMFSHGTMIKLTNVDLTNFGIKTIDALKARLADFYLTDSLKGTIETCIVDDVNLEIVFQNIEKSIAFKNFYAFFDNTNENFIGQLSNSIRMKSSIECISEKLRDVVLVNTSNFVTSGKQKFKKADGTMTGNLQYEMTGWIGIHSSIKKDEAVLNDERFLKNKTYRPNQLRLYVRKKLAVENFLDYIKNTQAFSNYIEGEISFDILDTDELDDIATSNRQGFIEDDERVQLLKEILKPIINHLIKLRIKIANNIAQDEAEYQAERERVLKEAKLQKEKELSEERKAKEKAVQDAAKAEKEVEVLNTNLRSEKKRNYFLFDALDEKQIDFAKRLHMLKINTATMSKTIKTNILKLQKGKFKENDAWEYFKKMSYFNARNMAVLEYGGVATFDPGEEYTTGDLYTFIAEYCNKILSKNDSIKVIPRIVNEAMYTIKFVPQDVIIILDNVVSNSVKHKAKQLNINMYNDIDGMYIDFIDDGNGINGSIKNVNELFEFGKGYTAMGTGVGLYHIKDIVENKLGGKVSILSEPNKGFTLSIKVDKVDEK